MNNLSAKCSCRLAFTEFYKAFSETYKALLKPVQVVPQQCSCSQNRYITYSPIVSPA